MSHAISQYLEPCQQASENHRQAALEHQGQLTKPPGSLGQLEHIAVTLAALQQRERPSVDRAHIAIFAGDHGVVDEGVSAFPQAVTVEMIRNFANGGAAICVLSKLHKIPLQVLNLGCAFPADDIQGVEHLNIAPGTANFCQQAAMTEAQLEAALHAGSQVIDNNSELELFIGGEMGIGNTSAATAIICALLNKEPADIAGAGTGLSSEGITHKAEVIGRALHLHQQVRGNALEILRCLGGLEIAALVGAYIRAGQRGVPVLVDGFICSAAALLAIHINPSLKPWLLLSHQSAEQGYQILIQHFDYEPLLNLQLRLGEGSGAASAYPLLQMACALHNNMATFAAAGVSEKQP